MNELLHSPFSGLTTPWHLGGIAIVLLIGYSLRILRWLTLSGAVAACLLGTWVVYHKGIVWLGPLAFFLASGSILNKLARSSATDKKDGKPRDAIQVICNGLPYGVCAGPWPFTQGLLTELGMVVSMAVATSDTWSSAIGAAMRGPTWDIVRWVRVPPGLSGGISLAGTTAGAVGALALVCMAYFCDHGTEGWSLLVLVQLLQVAAFGVLGMGLDSLLGALFQARYRDALGRLGDAGITLVSGRRWMTNDLVNLLSITIATAIAMAWRANAFT